MEVSMKVLITGANGFVGSHLLEYFKEKNDFTIVVAVREKNKLHISEGIEVRKGDLRDHQYVVELIKDIDVVCHTAAWSSVWKHKKESHELFYQPSIQLLNECVKQNVKRFIFISTTSAASPNQSHDPMSYGISRNFWPHINNIILIENKMRELASSKISMVNMRCGLFLGKRYNISALPILLPRLKTHLVPWLAGGNTSMPFVDGKDIAQAIYLAVMNSDLKGYESFNIVGPSIPTAREVITAVCDEYNYPKPHFSVPFPIGYAFGWLMEVLNPILPGEPLVTRSIIHLLEECNVDNNRARSKLGYHPKISWKESLIDFMNEFKSRESIKMSKSIL